MPEKYLNVAEVSEKYGYSQTYLRNMAAKGEIPAYKCRRKWVFKADEIEKAFLNSVDKLEENLDEAELDI